MKPEALQTVRLIPIPGGPASTPRGVDHLSTGSVFPGRKWLTGVASLFAAATCALAQGDLEPPGPPAATMKTLDQIEPRVDVLRLPGDSTFMHVIADPGSYFLSRGILAAEGKSGIRIRARNVTLDLRGFVIDGGKNGGTSGIAMDGGLSGIVIRDGTIKGFASSIQAGTGLTSSQVSRITAYGGATAGIDLGLDPGNLVERCTTTGGLVGIRAGRVHHCHANADSTSSWSTIGINASALVSYSSGIGENDGIRGGDVSHCIGEGNYGEGIDGNNISSSRGTSQAYGGIKATGDVIESFGSGVGFAGDLTYGIYAGGNVRDSTGIGGVDLAGDHNGHGIWSEGNVTNSKGTSYGGIGIKAAGTVSNSMGTAKSMFDEYVGEPYPGTAIQAPVISYSRAVSLSGAVGLSCSTAVGCVSNGTNSITNKYLMP